MKKDSSLSRKEQFLRMTEPRECPACWGVGWRYGFRDDDKLPCGICAETGKVVPYTPSETTCRPQWVVNDLGELGVKVGETFYWLYKGGNIVYKDPKHEDGTPMMYRIVGKREFGETQWPQKWVIAGRRQDRYTEELLYTPGLSWGTPEDGKWKPLPASDAQEAV